MTKVLVRVGNHTSYLYGSSGEIASPGDVVEIEVNEALLQSKAGNVIILDEDAVKDLDSVKKPDEALAAKDKEIELLRQQLSDKEKNKDAEKENKALREALAKMQLQIDKMTKSEDEQIEIKEDKKNKKAGA